MAQFPLGDAISLPATLNQTNWVAIPVDNDAFLMEASLSPTGNAAGNVSALIGKIAGGSMLGSVTTLSNPNGTNAFTSTNHALPTNYVEIFIGNWANAPPLITLGAVYNQEYKHLAGAIPVLHPPVLRRGEIVIVAAKNLTSSTQTVAWNLNVVRMSRHAQSLLADDVRSNE